MTKVAMAMAPAPAAGAERVVAAPVKQTEKALIVEFCRRFFSDARILARTKVWTFAGFLGFLGLGFTLKIRDFSQVPLAAGTAEFILASPEVAAVIGGLAAFCAVIGGNLYSRNKANAYRLRLYELAANPVTPDDTRGAILQEIAGR